ncbi:MAG TPA: NIPSNAP family protein [Bryobacteraceae bacterium]|nr:NIPSNAP family protein [Bryobacteraceae bacterium]
MNRRSFVESAGAGALLSALAGAPAQAQPSNRKTRIYRLDFLYCRQGSQTNRVQEFLASQMPVLTRHAQPVGVFTAVIAPHLPATAVLTGFSSLEEMETADDRVRKSAEYQAALEKMESGAEPPYDRVDRLLLRATDFSPEIAPLAERPRKPRIFELRIYHSPTERQLRYLQERFAGTEIGIFSRCGIHPLFYSNTLAGPNMPNLAYLIPFAGLAEREKAWDAFGADPEWVKARADSIARGGQIVAQSEITLLQAAAFSPIQ